MFPSIAADGALDLADVRRRVSAIFVGSIGNLVEWYDFYTYAAFALYFAGAFFPNSDPVVQQLNAALLFAAGFLVRPLGGWLFGFLADQHGRRGALAAVHDERAHLTEGVVIRRRPIQADQRVLL